MGGGPDPHGLVWAPLSSCGKATLVPCDLKMCTDRVSSVSWIRHWQKTDTDDFCRTPKFFRRSNRTEIVPTCDNNRTLAVTLAGFWMIEARFYGFLVSSWEVITLLMEYSVRTVPLSVNCHFWETCFEKTHVFKSFISQDNSPVMGKWFGELFFGGDVGNIVIYRSYRSQNLASLHLRPFKSSPF